MSLLILESSGSSGALSILKSLVSSGDVLAFNSAKPSHPSSLPLGSQPTKHAPFGPFGRAERKGTKVESEIYEIAKKYTNHQAGM